MTVKSMSEFTGDARLRSPEQCLEDCLKLIGKEGTFKSGKKLLVLCLDDSDGYDISWVQAGMSECLTLCRVSEQLFLHEMAYNSLPSCCDHD